VGGRIVQGFALVAALSDDAAGMDNDAADRHFVQIESAVCLIQSGTHPVFVRLQRVFLERRMHGAWAIRYRIVWWAADLAERQRQPVQS
jgi:hypothetical protein